MRRTTHTRVGIVGLEGSGKTTFIRCACDAGSLNEKLLRGGEALFLSTVVEVHGLGPVGVSFAEVSGRARSGEAASAAEPLRARFACDVYLFFARPGAGCEHIVAEYERAREAYGAKGAKVLLVLNSFGSDNNVDDADIAGIERIATVCELSSFDGVVLLNAASPCSVGSALSVLLGALDSGEEMHSTGLIATCADHGACGTTSGVYYYNNIADLSRNAAAKMCMISLAKSHIHASKRHSWPMRLLGKLDGMLSNDLFGLAFFLLSSFLMLEASVVLGGVASAVCASVFSYLASLIPDANIFFDVLADFIVGAGVAVGFVPTVAVVFLWVTVFEKTGYTQRVCRLFEGLFSRMGLPSSSIVSMVNGMSCSIMGYYAARLIPSRAERLASCVAVSFVPCSAKLSVLSLFAVSLFDSGQVGIILFFLYFFGYFFGTCSARLVLLLEWKFGLFFGDKNPEKLKQANGFWGANGKPSSGSGVSLQSSVTHPLVLPSFKGILKPVCMRVASYIKETAWLIAVFSVVLSSLFSVVIHRTSGEEGGGGGLSLHYERYQGDIGGIPSIENQNGEERLIVLASKVIAPIFEPIGLDWKMTLALIAGMISKEISVSAIAMLNNSSYAQHALSNIQVSVFGNFSFAQGISFIMFVFFYLPCVSATAVFFREVKSYRAILFLVLLTLGSAYGFSYLSYHLFR